jgi:hypothetical protein
MTTEAVQFLNCGPWHAVNPVDDLTYCGRNPLGAVRMWEDWATVTDHCKQCERATSGEYLTS